MAPAVFNEKQEALMDFKNKKDERDEKCLQNLCEQHHFEEWGGEKVALWQSLRIQVMKLQVDVTYSGLRQTTGFGVSGVGV